MFTNNFQKLFAFADPNATLKNVHEEEVTASNYRIQRYNYSPVTTTNNVISEQSIYSLSDILYSGTYTSSSGLILFVGSGTNLPTKDDYKLEKPLDLSVVAASCTHLKGKTLVERTFFNNTEEAVTINEVGLYVFKTEGPSTRYPSCAFVLVAHKILNEPIILAPNEAYTFSYQFRIKDINIEETIDVK